MLPRTLMALCFVTALLPPLSVTDALACGGRSAPAIPAEQAKFKKAFEEDRKADQARNIRGIDQALRTTKISASDVIKVKELRAQAAKLSEAGQFAEANRALREAWKTLGHPEKPVTLGVLRC
jgi:hypothetical protein